MNSQQFKNIRQELGLDRLQFARLIGYTGTDRNDVTRIRSYERGGLGGKQVPLYIAKLVYLLVRHYRSTGQLPTFPDWPGYQFSHEPDPQHHKETIDG
jgi:hypothetical protein